MQHKLREPIDRHLSIENPVDVPALRVAGQVLIAEEALLKLLAEAFTDWAGLKTALPLGGAKAGRHRLCIHRLPLAGLAEDLD